MKTVFINLIILLSAQNIFAQWVQSGGYNNGGIYSITTFAGEILAGCDGGIVYSDDEGLNFKRYTHKNGATTYFSVKKLEALDTSLVILNDKVFATIVKNNLENVPIQHFGSIAYLQDVTYRTNAYSLSPSFGNNYTHSFFRTDSGLFIAHSKGIMKKINSITTVLSSICGSNPNHYTLLDNKLLVSTKFGFVEYSFSNKKAIFYNQGLENLHVNKSLIVNNTVFLATHKGIYSSNDYTKGWTLSGIQNYSVFCLEYIDNKLIAGTDNGIYISSDNGLNWVASSNGLPDNTYVYCIYQYKNSLLIGTGSKGIWKAEISSLSSLAGNIQSTITGLNNALYLSSYTDCSISKPVIGLANKSEENDRLEIYPNPLTSGQEIHINSKEEIKEIKITSMEGFQYDFNRISDNIIKINSLGTKTMILKVVTNSKTYIQKVIIY